jgi:GntR family transcriptional regulator
MVNAFFVDPASPLPPWVQLKEQIKLAYATGQLKQGDMLPSVRALARRVGVGEAAVRRAYKELCQLSILSSERRKHVAVNDQMTPPSEAEWRVAEAEVRCDALLDWAKSEGLSGLSVSRLLTGRAAAREAAAPSYAYVDAGAVMAGRVACSIERAWNIKVQPLSLDELPGSLGIEPVRFTAVLVNSYRHETLLERIRGLSCFPIFPIRIRQNPRVMRRLTRLPARSSVLLVHTDDDYLRIGRSVSDTFHARVGKGIRFDSAPLSAIGELLGRETCHYRLIVASVHVWEKLPEKVRRMPNVIESQSEPEPESLEKVRMLAGVIV